MNVEEWLGKDNQLGQDIWHNKYQYNNETFDEWLNRISNGDNELKQLIIEKKFLFGGRILANRGLEKLGKKITLSNCYVITPPEDSIESIFDCAKKLARTYSYGGGCGVDLSKLAPKGASVNNAAKHTSGSVSFMDLYSLITDLIGQGGRRGALMLSLSCEHPDLEDFINVKSDLNKVTKANISIRITDKFMIAVKNHTSFTLKFTRPESGESIVKEIDAYDFFHKICEMNWDYAEPGMLFWDRIENWNMLSSDSNFHYAGTNPCAEEPLPAGGSCLLGSINLSKFISNNNTFDFDSFRKAVNISVIALNNVLDEGLNLHPLKEQKNSVKDWRQIGLGIFGLADMLIKLGITYGSIESIDLCDMIGYAMADEAIKTSALLSKDYYPYPKYNPEAIEQSAFFTKNALGSTKDLVKKYGLHNSQLLTIAPTGTLSTMIGVSGGIEPIFANYYTRKTESLHEHDEYYKVYTPIVKEYIDKNNIKDDNDLPNYFITAQNIDYDKRIDMQSIWQSHIDASISSTVNVPNKFTVKQVEDLYMYAWERGLKGVTIFRDGCKRIGILTTTDNKEEVNDNKELPRGYVISIDNTPVGKERHLVTGCGSLHCVAFFDKHTGKLVETYLSKGSQGGCQSNLCAISRLMSLCARGGIDVHDIVDQLASVMTCPSYVSRRVTKHDVSKGDCCPSAIGNALIDMYNEMQMELTNIDGKEIINNIIINTEDKTNKKSICPECGEPLTFEGGCNVCKNCGYSKCD